MTIDPNSRQPLLPKEEFSTFCEGLDHPEGLAIVVSHDRGVTFVANRGGDVVFWEQSVSP